MTDDPRPTRLGRYRLVRKVGRGGMATVFAAVQEGPHGFESEVAIKLVHPTLLAEHPQVVRMVVDEARVASRIRHPNVVRIIDLCEEPPDVLYVVMDYVDGVSMRQVLDTARALGTPPPLSPVLEVLAAACEGLHAAHQATQPDGTALNLVHRDIKPGNILVSADGEVKVGDFGIAFFGDRLVEATGHGQMKGTPAYMSPEQVLGTSVDARSDIFSMGLTLFTLTTARLAFQGETPMAMAMKIANESLEPHAQELDAVCFGLGDILRTACARAPVARYPQAAAMGAALREVREGLRSRSTIAEMVVASGWRPRSPEERPSEMSSIDARGTVVDVGTLARDGSSPPPPSGGRTTTSPFGEPEELETVGDEPIPILGEADEYPSVVDLAPEEGPAAVVAEVLPPDPNARPVEVSRHSSRPRVAEARDRVFASPQGPPRRLAAQPPPRSGSTPRAPKAQSRPPPLRPRRGAASPGDRGQPALERDYRGRMIRPSPADQDSRGIGLLETMGVAAAFFLVVVAVWVIANRRPAPDPFAEVESELPADEDLPDERVRPAAPSFAPEASTPEGGSPTPGPPPAPVHESPPVARRQAPTPPAPAAATPSPPRAPRRSEPSPAAVEEGTGLLTVNSYPWAEVLLDGRRIGNTPVLGRTLDSGAHTIRLEFSVPGPDGEVPDPVEKSVVVEVGEHEKVVHRP